MQEFQRPGLAAVDRRADIPRRSAVYSSVRIEPQSVWVRLTLNVWSRSFYIAPIGLALLVVSVLWLWRPGELDIRTFVVAWFLTCPVGFLLWIVAWQLYGSGSGRISATVGTTAILGWCALLRGFYAIWIQRNIRDGCLLCSVSVATMLTVRAVIGPGTAPILLVLVSGFAGATLPVLRWIAIQTNEFRHLAVQCCMLPFWRFLNRPFTF